MIVRTVAPENRPTKGAVREATAAALSQRPRLIQIGTDSITVRVSFKFPQAICGMIVKAILEIAFREFAVKSSQTGRICGTIRTPPTPCRPRCAIAPPDFDQHQGQDRLPQPKPWLPSGRSGPLSVLGLGSTARVRAFWAVCACLRRGVMMELWIYFRVFWFSPAYHAEMRPFSISA